MAAKITFRSSSTPLIAAASSVKNSPLTNLEMDANLKTISDDIAFQISEERPLALSTATSASVTAVASATITLTNKTINGNSNTITNISLASAVKDVLPVANGGTNAITAPLARVSLGMITSVTGAMILPVGTTAQQDAAPVAGYLRFNSTLSKLSFHNGTAWNAVGGNTAQVLVDAAIINWDMILGDVASVTLAGNRAMAVPTNIAVGTSMLVVRQDATGGRTLTFPSIFQWTESTAPVLSVVANARNVISLFYDGAILFGSLAIRNAGPAP